VYVYGLLLDGARWSHDEGTLKESEPKVLFSELPVLHVTAMTKGMLQSRNSMFGSRGPYPCPCYKYPSRTDKYLIFTVNLVTKYQDPDHWILRGVALLCSKD
jgi:dynein heavy chain